jgi:hypothetical protein
MEPSEESGGLPMEVDAWEKEASPGRVSSHQTFADAPPGSVTTALVSAADSNARGSRECSQPCYPAAAISAKAGDEFKVETRPRARIPP